MLSSADELFPLPPLDEQERIVALLDKATAAVAELEAVYSQTASKVGELRASALGSAIAGSDWPLVRLGDVLRSTPLRLRCQRDPFVPMDAVAVGQRHRYTEPRGKRGVRERGRTSLLDYAVPAGRQGCDRAERDRSRGGSTEFIVLRAGDRVHTGLVSNGLPPSRCEQLASLMVGAIAVSG